MTDAMTDAQKLRKRQTWREASNRYRERKREQVRKANREAKRVRRASADGKTKEAETRKAWLNRHPEKRQKYWSTDRAKSRDKRRERERARRIANPGAGAEAVRSWRKLNPARARIQALVDRAKRRARMNSAPGSVTAQQIADLFAVWQCCAYCRRSDCKLTIDHVQPLTRGGSNDISNLVPACRSCNSRKHNKTIEEWRGLPCLM